MPGREWGGRGARDRPGRLLGRQRNRINMPAIIGFGAMGGAPVAEKLLGIVLGAQTQILHLADTGTL